MEAVTQLQQLAEKNGVSLEELCVYALGTPEEQASLEGENKENVSEDSSSEDDEVAKDHFE